MLHNVCAAHSLHSLNDNEATRTKPLTSFISSSDVCSLSPSIVSTLFIYKYNTRSIDITQHHSSCSIASSIAQHHKSPSITHCSITGSIAQHHTSRSNAGSIAQHHALSRLQLPHLRGVVASSCQKTCRSLHCSCSASISVIAASSPEQFSASSIPSACTNPASAAKAHAAAQHQRISCNRALQRSSKAHHISAVTHRSATPDAVPTLEPGTVAKHERILMALGSLSHTLDASSCFIIEMSAEFRSSTAREPKVDIWAPRGKGSRRSRATREGG